MTTSAEYVPQIQTHLDAMAKCESDTLGHAQRCGLSLLGAKYALKQENAQAETKGVFGALWQTWVKSNFDIAVSTADMYIDLHQNREAIAKEGCKSITDARKCLPKRKASSQKGKKAQAKHGDQVDKIVESAMENTHRAQVEGDEDEDDNGELSEEEREEIVLSVLTSTKLPDLADVLVDNFSRDQLNELYQLIGERLQARGAATTGGRNPTAVGSSKVPPPMGDATAVRRGVTA